MNADEHTLSATAGEGQHRMKRVAVEPLGAGPMGL